MLGGGAQGSWAFSVQPGGHPKEEAGLPQVRWVRGGKSTVFVELSWPGGEDFPTYSFIHSFIPGPSVARLPPVPSPCPGTFSPDTPVLHPLCSPAGHVPWGGRLVGDAGPYTDNDYEAV